MKKIIEAVLRKLQNTKNLQVIKTNIYVVVVARKNVKTRKTIYRL